MQRHQKAAVLVVGALALAACGTPAGQPGTGQDGRGPQPGQSRTLTIAMGAEIDNLAARLSGSVWGSDYDFMLNSPLVVLDAAGRPHPRLAASLPSTSDGSWVVNADNTMRTTWKIRPNAKWHDGRPVAATDFVFAHQAYLDPGVPIERRQPEALMDRIEPIDNHTFVIHWKESYPRANELTEEELQPLPEHLLGGAYRSESIESFLAAPFWTTPAYVGTGPYRLVQWERGSQLIFEAFPDYVLGRPAIDRVVFRLIADPTAVVANLLSGTVDASINITLGANAAATVRDAWAPVGGGTILHHITRFRYLQIQFNPAFLGQPALMDVRVRRAIVHGIDRATLAEIVTVGGGRPTDVFLSPHDALYARAAREVAAYPYDQRRASALLQEVGWTKTGDQLVSGRGETLKIDIAGTQGTDNETEQGVVASDLRKLGMDASQTVLGRAVVQDREVRAMFPGLNQTAFGIEVPETLRFGLSSQCPNPRTRWTGGNRGCWANPEFDRLYQIAFTTLDQAERYEAILGALRIVNDDVGIVPLFHYGDAIAYRKGLVGPGPHWPAQGGDTWNIHEWRWE